MSGNGPMQVNRRAFLQTGAVATASAVSVANGSQAAPPLSSKAVFPRRRLGNTGVEVTMLELGTWRSPGLKRLLRVAYESGVRTYDTADCYGSEPGFAQWFKAMPEVRKEIFL